WAIRERISAAMRSTSEPIKPCVKRERLASVTASSRSASISVLSMGTSAIEPSAGAGRRLPDDSHHRQQQRCEQRGPRAIDPESRNDHGGDPEADGIEDEQKEAEGEDRE